MAEVSPTDRTAKRDEVIAKLHASDKVFFKTVFRGFPMIHIRDKELVESLAARGASVNWYTRSRNPQVRECEVLLGPGFMA
jgi:hypothetical protein